MNDRRTDSELVAGHLTGDASALAGIYDRYADRLYDTAAAMLGDRHEAADVVQDVILIAAERVSQLRDPARLKSWLFAILRNEVYRRTKRRRRSLPTDFSAPGTTEMPAPTDPAADGARVAYEQLAELVRSAAAGLDPRDQLVLELSTRQGLTGSELAAALGVSPEHGHVMVHRMRERVERSLGALVVARTGRADCPELAEILRGWDGTFSVLIRKRVARHVDGCATCEGTKRRFAVVPLLGAAPALAAPAELRDRVLRRAAAPGGGSGSDVRFDERDGFPFTPSTSRRTLVLVAAAVLAALLLAGAGTAISLTRGGGGAAPVAVGTSVVVAPATAPGTGPSTAPSTTSTPASSAPASSAPASSVVVTTVTATTVATQPAAAPPVVTDPPAPGTTASPPRAIPPVPPGDEPPATTTTTPPSPPPSTTVAVLVAPTVPPPAPLAVTVVRSVPTITCPWSVDPLVGVLVTGGDPVSSVTLSWRGPGRPGAAAMSSAGAGQWRGQLGIDRVNGVWTFTVSALGAGGATAGASGTIVVAGC